MFTHGLGFTNYYVDYDPHRQDLLREAARCELARETDAGQASPAEQGRRVKESLRRLAVLGVHIVRLALQVRPAGPHPRRQVWS